MSEHTKYLKTIFAYFITSNDTCDCSYRKFKNDRTRVELSIEWCRSESWGVNERGFSKKKHQFLGAIISKTERSDDLLF